MTAETAKPLIPVLRRRVRALAQLAGVTALFVILAIVAVWQRASIGEPDFNVVRMFPSLRAAVESDSVAAIQIETKDASFNVVRNDQKQWLLPDKEKYPADIGVVRKTLLGLAELDLVEQKTARSDWHEKLGLKLPKSGGTGTLVTLKDAKGEALASVIVGSSVEGGAAAGQQAMYVRRPNEPQAYVARGNFIPVQAQAQWLNKAFVELAKDRVKSAAMKPLKGKPYTVERAKPADENFRMVDAIPAGRILRTPNEPNGVGNALLGISFDDVKPVANVDFANAARASYATFDGLTLNLAVAEKDNEYWVKVEAVANPVAETAPAASTSALKPDVAKEAKEINEAFAPWAFKIPRYKGALLSAPFDDLLVAAGSPGR